MIQNHKSRRRKSIKTHKKEEHAFTYLKVEGSCDTIVGAPLEELRRQIVERIGTFTFVEIGFDGFGVIVLNSNSHEDLG